MIEWKYASFENCLVLDSQSGRSSPPQREAPLWCCISQPEGGSQFGASYVLSLTWQDPSVIALNSFQTQIRTKVCAAKLTLSLGTDIQPSHAAQF